MQVELIHWQVHPYWKADYQMLELFFNTKTTISLLRGEWRENGSFVGDKYPIQSAFRMAKNACDSFHLGP